MSANELLSICIQHENDHLDGVVFLERLSFIKRNFLTKKYLKGQKRRKTPLIIELNLSTTKALYMEKLKIAFFGTPDFAVPTLELLNNHPQVELIQVVSMPDRKSGRGENFKALLSLSLPRTIDYTFFKPKILIKKIVQLPFIMRKKSMLLLFWLLLNF